MFVDGLQLDVNKQKVLNQETTRVYELQAVTNSFHKTFVITFLPKLSTFMSSAKLSPTNKEKFSPLHQLQTLG